MVSEPGFTKLTGFAAFDHTGTPYWNHKSLVDWTGAAHGFGVPLERVLFAPTQWLYHQVLRAPPLPPHLTLPSPHTHAAPCKTPQPSLALPCCTRTHQGVKLCCAAADCDSVDTRDADVCTTDRRDADPDACCRAARRRRALPEPLLARRREASVPTSAVDVATAGAPQVACVLARGDGHTAKVVERRTAATGPPVSGAARTPRNGSSGGASFLWQLLG